MAEKFPKDTAQQRIYRAIETLVAVDDAEIDLAQVALLIASLEYPDLDIAYYIKQLDELARRVREELTFSDPAVQPDLPPEQDPLIVINAINKILFEEEKFRGNRKDYYNPDNSLLNKVLEQHTGIPITLSLIYMEVGKRVGIQINGVGLPHHFVVSYQFPEEILFIDSFAGGLFLSEEECQEYLRRVTRGKLKFRAQWFKPVSHRVILVRLLNNLKHIYIDLDDYQRALTMCDLILMLTPQLTHEWRDRGIVHLQLKHYARALHDLNTYIERAPKASDHQEILKHISTIRQFIAMMN